MDYKATAMGQLNVAVLALGLSMDSAVPLPARVQTVPRRSSLQHEYVVLLMWDMQHKNNSKSKQQCSGDGGHCDYTTPLINHVILFLIF